MSINMNAAIPDNKRKENYGKNYYAIDFEINDKLTAFQYKNQWEKGATRPVVGTLEIGSHNVPVTLKELEKLQETIQEAMNVVSMNYRIGKLL